MKLFKAILPTLAFVCVATALKAEDTPAPATPAPKAAETKPADAATPAESKQADSSKPADSGEFPSAPKGDSPLTAVTQNASFSGDISQASQKGKNKDKNKDNDKVSKKAAKNGVTDPAALVLHVTKEPKDGKKVKGDKEAKPVKFLTLVASGDIMNQLKSFAEKNAHIKVTGSLDGGTLTVKEVAEAPDDSKKKKKKNDDI